MNNEQEVQEVQTVNPLLDCTRRDSVFVKLPSNGHFTPSNNITLTTEGEIGIKAMTTADEISLTTPEALLNGEAIKQVIKNCVSSIKDPGLMATSDIDAILVGIRLASYGENMDVDIVCPECEQENNFEAPIHYCLENMNFLESEYPVQLSENTSSLIVKVRPFNFNENIQEAMFQFNETKALNMVIQENFEEDEELKQSYNDIVKNIAANNISLVSQCVLSIYATDGNKFDVSDEQIEEWITQLPTQDAKLITAKIAEINRVGVEKHLDVVCQHCDHTWSTELNFDPSSFFEASS